MTALPPRLSWKHLAFGTLLIALLCAPGRAKAEGSALEAREGAPTENKAPLTILGPNFPRAFFFRAAEGPPAQPATLYENWSGEFDRLMGIIGKCLDEEVLGREKRNPEFFARFKREHPNQVVLLHFNGNARDPRHATAKYFPGHWIYRQATLLLSDLPAQEGESTLRVADVSDFEVNTGRYKNANDDLALFAIGPDGRHDWSRCEQVQLVAVDAKTGTIRVRRGCYGTRPLAFKAGTARIAAHAVEGPWGKNNHLMWFYNFSTHCPRDPEGKTAADRLVEDLAGWFGPGGKLEAFDGLEFDVMFNETHGDTDGDGRIDNGIIEGRNHYGIGVIEFARQLRAVIGDRRIIQGDGALGPGGRRSQRAFGILNGIESEGFPNLNDWEFNDWSGGLNRHAFWQLNARPPAFNYINHKWNQPVPGMPGEHRNPEVPFSRHRLSFAAAQFTDAALCYSFAPPRERGTGFPIWDELRCGTEKRIGWLGRPEAPPLHLATKKARDLLEGSGNPVRAIFAKHITGPVVTRTLQGDGIEVLPENARSDRLQFTLRNIPTSGNDLVIQVTMRGSPMRNYPAEMARFVECELTGGIQSLMGGQPEITGIGLRGKSETPISEESGARIQIQPRATVAGHSIPAVSIHPPYKSGKGYVFWCRDVDVSEGTELRFKLGMSEKAPARSDGVWFRVFAATITEGSTGPYKPLFERSSKAHAWVPCAVSLSPYAGKRVRLKFVADCGPADNATTDQGFWGDVKLARTGQNEESITSAVSSMTWLNEKTFTSVFYYRNIRSSTVDLSFSIDGGEPVTLLGVTAHAHPDTMVRVFENGLVLANPSLQPQTFDLADLTPGRAYRRLKGSPEQDAKTNNGSPVNGTVVLGERDALFLERVR